MKSGFYSLLPIASCVTLIFAVVTVRGASIPGYLLREVYNDISGVRLADLTSNANFPECPDVVDLVSSFEAPVNAKNNYGTRLSGNVPTGGYTLTRKAIDHEGPISTSPPVKITVALPEPCLPAGLVSWWRGEDNSRDSAGDPVAAFTLGGVTHI